MPVVAQINVNFANLQEVRNIDEINVAEGGFQQIDDKAVSPLTLAKYCLYNREDSEPEGFNFGMDSVTLLQYVGGFLTAGDLINVKHSDLQVRKNIDVGQNLYSEFIYSKRKNDNGEENTDSTYKEIRSLVPRSITIAPKEQDTSTNYFRIITSNDTTSRSITLYCSRASDVNSILINSESTAGTGERIDITSRLVNITKNNAIDGVVNINSFLNVRNDTKINTDKFVVTASDGKTQIAGNLLVGSTTTGVNAYNNFTVDSTNGNTVSKGTLDVTGNSTLRSNVTIQGNSTATSPSWERFVINDGSTERFTVISANGNTDIQGTLNVVDNVTLQKNVTLVGNTSTTSPEIFKITDGSTDRFTVISANGNTDIQGTLTLLGNFTLNSTKFKVTASTGATQFEGDLGIGASTAYDKFTVASSTGNTAIAGTLSVTSTSTFTDTITLNSATPENKRIIGLRNFTRAEIIDVPNNTYDSNALNVQSFRDFSFDDNTATKSAGFTVSTIDHDRTYICTNTSPITISLDSSARIGTQVSFIRTTDAGTVQITGAQSALNFNRLAFKNSAATALKGANNVWYLFGDLLP